MKNKFKFGEKVVVWDDGDDEMVIAYFVAYSDSDKPYIVSFGECGNKIVETGLQVYLFENCEKNDIVQFYEDGINKDIELNFNTPLNTFTTLINCRNIIWEIDKWECDWEDISQKKYKIKHMFQDSNEYLGNNFNIMKTFSFGSKVGCQWFYMKFKEQLKELPTHGLNIDNNKHEYFYEILAFAYGYEIERFHDNDGGWYKEKNPSWEKTTYFRVKGHLGGVIQAYKNNRVVQCREKDIDNSLWVDASLIMGNSIDFFNRNLEWRIKKDNFSVGDWVTLIKDNCYKPPIFIDDRELGDVFRVSEIIEDKSSFTFEHNDKINYPKRVMYCLNMFRLASKEEVLNSRIYNGTATPKDFPVELGDYVQLVDERPSDWNKFGLMNKFLGNIVKVTDINNEYFAFKGTEGWTFRLRDIKRYPSKEEIGGKEQPKRKPQLTDFYDELDPRGSSGREYDAYLKALEEWERTNERN